MGHPIAINEEAAALLKESGCYRLQLGIQSMDEQNRKKLLHRPESNAQVRQCFEILDRHKVLYSIDHIFGLPNERDEKHLYDAAWEYSNCKSLHKINCFFLTCFPKTPMVDYAVEYGMIKPEDVEKINQGYQDFYYDYGITGDPKLKRLFKAYAFFFRIIPILPIKARYYILKRGLVKYLFYLPKTITFFSIDMFLTFKNRDPVSHHLLSQYLTWLKRIIFQGGVK